LWAADVVASTSSSMGAPGTVLAVSPEGIAVGTGEGALRITQLQRAGGKRLPAGDFLRGFELRPGMAFVTA
jgi:methionyl-tRNA formyltransferase